MLSFSPKALSWWQPMALLMMLAFWPNQEAQATCYVWMPTLNSNGSCIQASYYPAAYGTVVTMWAKNVNGNIYPVTNWSTNTSMTFCPSQPGAYRLCAKRIGCSKVYETGDVYISSCSPITNGGTISGAGGSYCGSFNPPAFSGTQASGGSGGNIVYQWQYRTPGGVWYNAQATGCNSQTGYNPPTLYQSYEFRRLAKRSGCGNWVASNVVSFTITGSLSNGGTIYGQAGYFCAGYDPGPYNGSKPGGSNGATVEYQWQYRSPGGQWMDSNAPGATSEDGFDPAPVTSSVQYRRLARIPGCGYWKCSNTICIYIKPAPVVNAGNDVALCEGESATLHASATGCGPYTYQWNQGLGSGKVKTVNPVLAGYANEDFFYQVTVTDGNGCTASDEVKVSVLSTPQATISSTNPSCGSATGSIVLTFPNHPNRSAIEFSLDGGATWPTTYKVNDNAGSLTIGNLAAGDYDVVVRWGNNQCAMDLGTANLSDNGGPVVHAGADVTVCEGETASLMASATGVTPFTFEWNQGLGAGAAVSVTPTLPGFENKTFSYTVTATDGNGCTGTDVVKVEVLSKPDVTVSSTDPSCVGNDATLTFTFPDHPDRSEIEFSLDGGATWPASLKVGDETASLLVNNLAAGSYDLKARWSNGECAVDLGNVTLNTAAGGCASLGDLVWDDKDRDGELDLGEPGVQGVNVTLFKCGETTPIASVDTDSSGAYSFTNLLPGMSYYVVFNPVTLPMDYVFSGKDLGGNEATDSDADANGVTDCVTLSAGQNYLDLDAGINKPAASLGDFVFNDVNKDGVQGPSELGIGNVLVTLTDCSGNFVAQTTTNGSGFYSFTNVDPGSYKVTFAMNTLPAGFVFTSQFQGGNDSKDSDVNSSTGTTDCINLGPGENNMDIDAGAYVTVTCNADAGTLSMNCPSATYCRQFGRATIIGVNNNDEMVPSGYSLLYVLTTGPAKVIIQTKSTPTFEVTADGNYAIHKLVYNSTVGDGNFFNVSNIVLGTTTVSSLYTTFTSGGGVLCGDVDVVGEPATVITCVDPRTQTDFYNTVKDTPVSGNLRDNDENPYNNPLWISILIRPAKGTMTLAEDGSFTYTPNAGFVGLDSARYRLRDTTLCNHRNSFSWVYFTVTETESVEPGEENLFANGPAVFLELSVEKEGLSNVLTWTTLEDTVDLIYQVERSFDQTLFERVLEVEARGEPGSPETYEFVEDSTPYQEIPQISYRIRTVDPQGYFTISETVVLYQNEIDPLIMEVYPVPARTEVFVTWSLRDQPAKVLLLNGLGQTLEVEDTETGAFETSFDVNRLTPGVYYLQVQAGGYFETKSFVVER